MPYGIKYISEFDRLTSAAYPSYTLQILQKNYDGPATRLTSAASAVIHNYDTDEPKPPIKGSSLQITLVNEGNFPLTSIYSIDDEEYKARLIWHYTTDVVMFEGFIVQDDCSELMADWNHEITIAANDNLGLLKDVSLDKAPASYDLLFISTEEYSILTGGGDTAVIFSTGFGNSLSIGDKITLDGEGPYEIRDLQQGSGPTGLWNAYLVEDLASAGPVTEDVGVYRSSLLEKITLLSVVKRCLSATGLELNTRIFSNINEITTAENTVRFFEQTLIDPQTFYEGDKYDDCYTVLEKLFTRYNCTLFQAKGTWNIIRWPEIRYYDFNVPGTEYDPDFLTLGNAHLNGRITDGETVIFAGYPKFIIGVDEHTVAETGLLQRITRPFQFTKETFNYRQPDELLRNGNLQQLGSQITTYTEGEGEDLRTITEYNAPWWYYTDASPTSSGVNGPAEYFIRVVQDNLGNEIERYMVVKNNDVHSYQIEVNAGDIIRFSFGVKTTDNFSTIIVYLRLTDGTNIVFANEDPADPWRTTVGYNASTSIEPGQWSGVEAETKPIPFDGLLTVYLRALSSDGNGENCYNDIRLEVITSINASTKIIGHTHTSEQNPNTKNNDEHEIFVDNTQRNSIAGTLYLNELNGLLQKRCNLWKRATYTEQKRLGEIITQENLFIRKEARMILEGTCYGLTSNIVASPGVHDHVSMLNILRYTHFPEFNYIFGRLEVDYRNNKFSGTLFEMYKDNEQDSDLTYSYTFEFLYDSK